MTRMMHARPLRPTRCRFCGGYAMPGDTVCYACNG
jgi:hypothetical protein